MGVQRKLEITSDLKELVNVRCFARDICTVQENLVDKKTVDRFVLAANEAAANIMIHAYERDPEKQIEIEARVDRQSIALAFYDWGTTFNPESVPLPKLDGSQSGGFGIFMMRQALDRLEFTRDDRGRNCTLLEIIV